MSQNSVDTVRHKSDVTTTKSNYNAVFFPLQLPQSVINVYFYTNCPFSFTFVAKDLKTEFCPTSISYTNVQNVLFKWPEVLFAFTIVLAGFLFKRE
jgi:hypothetical protein